MRNKAASPRSLRAAALLAGALAGLGSQSVARAQGATDICIDSSDRGQVLRDQGSLRDAREAFLACSKESCPEPIRLDCQAWFEDVERRIPSIVVRPRDSLGRDLADVRVFDGGRLLTEAADGRAISVDPGRHELRFERVGSPSVILELVARETEKGRLIDVVLPTGAATGSQEARAPGSGSSVPAGAWLLGGVGLLGIGAFAYLGWSAKSDVDEMRRTCAPFCADSRVEDARTRVVLANVSLGVGALALGAATWLALSGSTQAPERSGRVRLVVEPRTGGLGAGVAASF